MRKNTMRKNIGLSVKVDGINDNGKTTKIVLEDILPMARNKLENYQDCHIRVISAVFDSNFWIFRHKYEKRNTKFDFEFVENIIKFSKSGDAAEELINILKCWISIILNEKSLDSVRASYNDILSALHSSQCFSNISIDKFYSDLSSNNAHRLDNKKKYIVKEISDASLDIYCRNIIDFLNFYDSKLYSEYINRAALLKSEIIIIDKSREIPEYIDIITFKKYIEYWIEEISHIDNLAEYICFFPVYFWWEVTTIIPMRPTEFCTIRRDCLTTEGTTYYLTFPRLKKHRKGKNRITDFIDKLPIPEIVYNRLSKYIELTNGNTPSEYLFNFEGFVESTREVDIIYEEDEVFSRHYLYEIISKFYKLVIHEQYKVSINEVRGKYKFIMYPNRKSEFESMIDPTAKDSINTMLKPGDLRHIAILNMLLQGYDPVEIQRLAGHISESTQLGYQRHMQMWVDGQIQQLALDFSMHNHQIIHSGIYKATIHPKAVQMFNGIYKQAAYIYYDNIEIPERQKLNIGFCADETMPCPTFNWRVKGCYLCKHWRISLKELETNQNDILEDLSILYDELREKVNFLKSLLIIHTDHSEDLDPETRRSITVTGNEVQQGITSIAKIMSMLGVK